MGQALRQRTRRDAATVARIQGAVLVAAAVLFLLAGLQPVVHYDLWHEMALARELVASGRFPYADTLSYAPTLPLVVHHEWLAGVLGYAAWSVPHGLFALWLALVAAVAVFLAWSLRRTDPALVLAAALLVGPMIMFAQAMPVLAQAYSVACAAFLLYCFERHERGDGRWFGWWLVVYVAWVNLHGGVVVAFAMVGSYAAERALRGKPWRALAILLVAMAALMAVNPYGWHLYGFLARAITIARPRGYQWAPDRLWAGHVAGAGMFLASLAAAILLAVRRRKLEPGFLVMLALAALTARAHKMIPFYGLSWLFWFGRLRLTVHPRLTANAAAAAAAFAVLLATLIAGRAPWRILVPGTLPGYELRTWQPVGPADYLARLHFKGNVLTAFQNGAYLAWRLAPDVKVSCDSRYEVAYPPADADRNLDLFFDKPALLAGELARLPRTDAALCPRGAALEGELRRLGWQPNYEDDRFILFFPPGVRVAAREDRRGQLIFESL